MIIGDSTSVGLDFYIYILNIFCQFNIVLLYNVPLGSHNCEGPVCKY